MSGLSFRPMRSSNASIAMLLSGLSPLPPGNRKAPRWSSPIFSATEGTARHRMASDLVELRCHGRTGQQEIHELWPRKQNAVSKYPVAVSNQSQRAA